MENFEFHIKGQVYQAGFVYNKWLNENNNLRRKKQWKIVPRLVLEKTTYSFFSRIQWSFQIRGILLLSYRYLNIWSRDE